MGERAVLISEVGPRDGLQNCKAVMSVADRCSWIAVEAAAGVAEIEVGAFVSPKVIPQMAGTEEVVRFARTIPGLTVAVLVPNLEGARRAVACGAHKITLPLSVSETHSLRNVRRNHAQMLEEARLIAELLAKQPKASRPHFEGSLSTAFGCTLEGKVAEAAVVRLAEALLEAGCDEVGLSDTTGYADPAAIRRLIRSVRASAGAEKLTGVHLHNTRGLGLANALAAFEEGMSTFDASLAGLGGCPTAPGASGNIVTEDLVFMFEAMGVRTGIDLPALLACRDLLRRALPEEELHGMLAKAGLPLGWPSASLQAA